MLDLKIWTMLTKTFLALVVINCIFPPPSSLLWPTVKGFSALLFDSSQLWTESCSDRNIEKTEREFISARSQSVSDEVITGRYRQSSRWRLKIVKQTPFHYALWSNSTLAVKVGARISVTTSNIFRISLLAYISHLMIPWYHIQLWNVTPATQQSPSQEKLFDDFRFVWTRKLRIGWDWGMAGLGRIYIIEYRKTLKQINLLGISLKKQKSGCSPQHRPGLSKF